MDKLNNIEEYTILYKQFRKEHKNLFSNLYMMPQDIERYISLGRAEYEMKEDGLFFYFDEESYYRLCMCVETGKVFNIPRRDKKILVRNLYRKNEQNEKLNNAERNLEKNGFDFVGTTFQIQGNTMELLQNCSRLNKCFLSLEKRGFRCVEADYSQYKEIEELILDSNIIKDYQLPYHTEQEKQMMSAGSYLCVINKQNQICAAAISDIKDGIVQNGAIAVKEEYKMLGIALLLTQQRLKWYQKHKIDLSQGWILTNNDASISYNKRLGYQMTGKYANEWLLMGEN